MSDNKFMQRALSLATKGKGRTRPNPVVGAVVVKNGQIISSDYHRKAGSPHAEVLALRKAGSKAKNSTIYVNLEPCCHTDKRTPPCTQEIIRSGVTKVVVAMIDPNPKVAGKGISRLRRAGLETAVGVLQKEAEKINESFAKYISTGTPFVTLKLAQSIDGKIATVTGNSKWITGPKSREYVHKLRNDVDALLVGIGTIKKDNPSLDCRISNGTNPVRIIVDSSLQIPLNAKVLRHQDRKTIIATTKKASSKKIERLKHLDATVLRIPEKEGKVNLKHLMKKLGKMDITSVMIEGGSSVASSALSDKIVDKVLFFIAPKIIGGTDSIPSIGGRSPMNLRSAVKLRDISSRRFDEDILIEGYL